MALGKKTGGRNFEKGNKFSKGGQKVPLELKISREKNRIEFENTLNRYVKMNGYEIDQASKNQNLPILEMAVAKVLHLAWAEGDTRRLDFILDRLIGRTISEPEIKDVTPPPQLERHIVSFKEFCKNAGYFEPFESQEEMRSFGFDNEATRLLLGARNYGKTVFVTILGAAYKIYSDPKYTILIITKSKSRNTAIINEIANALTKNGVELEKENSNCLRVAGHIGQNHSVEVITIKTSMRGRHPDMIIMDDPVTDEDTSEAMRNLVKKKYDEALKLSKNILIIGQPAHAHDLYAELRTIVLKKEVPWGSIKQLDDDLEALKMAGIDPISIEMSYHLRIPDTGTTPFSKIKYIDTMPHGDCVAFIDPSDGGDHTAMTIGTGYFDGMAVYGIQWKKAWYHCIDDIVAILKARRVKKVCFETNATGSQPIEQLRQVLSQFQIGVVGKHSDSNKHACIMQAGSYASRIYLSKESEKTYTDQVIKYEYGAKYDDAPDSLARLLEWLGLVRGKK